MNNYYSLNFGPQHPAAHGVLRLILTLKGEKIVRANPQIGLLHRGTEKLLEYKTFNQGLPYFDRLDYVSRLANEHVFARGYELLTKESVTWKVQFRRVVRLEITRILNHLIAVTTHIIDVGAVTPFLWAFEEREKIFEIYECLSGARRHANWRRCGTVRTIIDDDVSEKIKHFCEHFFSRLDEREELLTMNRIWIMRTQGVGIMKYRDALSRGCSGVRLRSTGIRHDLRVNYPYERYECLNVQIPVGQNGDCYDRYLRRRQERRESVRIIINRLRRIKDIGRERDLEDAEKKEDIERVIKHFKIISSAKSFEKGIIYCSAEAPKGEFGVIILKRGRAYFERVKIKAPGLRHLFCVEEMAINHLLADVVTILGTQDIVFGEIDR
jgi:NADH dehydrogenase (ubiquinone) Fe-S protein 2